MKFTIPRDKWLRGEGFEVSSLLRASDGKMCCLGHFGLACGLNPERLENVGTPSNIAVDVPEVDIWEQIRKAWTGAGSFLFKEEGNELSDFCNDLMRFNDRIDLSGEDREARIIGIFAQNGIEVEFVD